MNKMSAQAEKKLRREKFKLEGRPEWMSQELWAACERAFRAKMAQEANKLREELYPEDDGREGSENA